MDWVETVESETKTGYLYSLWDEKLTVYQGTIRPNLYGGCSNFFGDGGKRITCANKPGIVYKASVYLSMLDPNLGSMVEGLYYVVWLPRRNDDKAKKILIGYVESIIIDLEEKIKNQRVRIDMIKNVQIDPK